MNSSWPRILAGEDPATVPGWSIWDPGIVIEEIAEFPDAGRYEGTEGLYRWIEGWRELFAELRIEPREFIPAGDHVLVPTHQRFRSAAGAEVEQDIVQLWRLRDGRAVYLTGYRDREKALEAVGLTEDEARSLSIDP